MSNPRTRQIKKQAEEVLDEMFKSRCTEVMAELVKVRCDGIEDYVKAYLTKNDQREKAIRGWLVHEVKFKIQNDLFNATCTVDAIVEVLAESGIMIPDFNAKVDTRKQEIAIRLKQRAEEKMMAEQAARNAAAETPAEAKIEEEEKAS